MPKRFPTRPATSSTAAFARYLLQAMGLGATAAAALGGTACGAKVAVDTGGVGGDGSGGTTATGTTTTDTSTVTNTTTTTTTATATCDQPSVVYPPLEVCIGPQGPGGSCLPKEAKEVWGSIFMWLEEMSCGGADLVSVLCGPDAATVGTCCYVVDGISYECGGRPFVIEGVARVASVAARSDWTARGAANIADLDAETRDALAAAWTRSALDEHASVASFARFVLELLAVGAPADLVAAAQRAMGDEICHAELCFGLASAYGGRAIGPGPLAIEDGVGARADLAAIAAAAVREGCVGETLAAFAAGAARDAAEDAAVRAALDVIARDESEHAALAFRFVAWAVREGGGRVRAAVQDAFAAALSTPPAPLPESAGEAEIMRAHGQLPHAARRDLAARCLAEVVAPCAQALLSEIGDSPAPWDPAWSDSLAR